MPGKSSKDAVDASKNVADKDGVAAKSSFLDALKAKGRDVKLDAKIIKVDDEIVALAVRALPQARNDALMFDASALPGKIMNKFASDKLGFGTSKYFLAIKNVSTAPGWLYSSSMRDHVMRDFVVDTLELPTAFTPLGDGDDVIRNGRWILGGLPINVVDVHQVDPRNGGSSGGSTDLPPSLNQRGAGARSQAYLSRIAIATVRSDRHVPGRARQMVLRA